MTVYPSGIDNNLTLEKVTDLITPIRAKDHNTLQEAIVAIQAELGTNPSGVFGTVSTRLDDILTSLFANDVSILDTDGYFVATEVEGALRELAIEVLDLAVSIVAGNVSIANADGYFFGTNVETALRELATGEAVRIGEAEDNVYTDGLFTDFTPDTKLGVAIDRFNEVLGSLAPPPAPSLGDISYTTALGTTGKVSFGSSNGIATYANISTIGGGLALDTNGIFDSAGSTALRKGIYATGSNKGGVIANSVAADSGTPTPSYPANAFGDGEKGNLELEVNGVIVHTVNLASFGSGISVNANGSGFGSISAATPISFPSGDALTLFQYRTANWIVSSADEQNGHNYVRIIHNNSPSFVRSTNYFEWVVDNDTTSTLFSAESMSVPTMSGSKTISGVTYHTGGTANYFVTINNLHRNTYSSSTNAISHPISTNCSILAEPLVNITTELDTFVISGKVATIDVNRILDGNITVNIAVDRTVQADITSGAGVNAGGVSNGMLVDNTIDASTFDNELIDGGEAFRLPSNRSLLDITGFTIGGAGLWNSALSIVESVPLNAGYDGFGGFDAGLLAYNGQLYYPNNSAVAANGNFSAVAFGPAGNVNYSTATGQRTFWRYFYFSNATSNFILNLNATATVVNAGLLTASTNEISVELLLPNTTSNGSNVEFKDCNQNYAGAPPENNIGCFASTNGINVGDTNGADWGLATGTRNTSTSGSAAIIRLTVASGWTGSVNQLRLRAF